MSYISVEQKDVKMSLILTDHVIVCVCVYRPRKTLRPVPRTMPTARAEGAEGAEGVEGAVV